MTDRIHSLTVALTKDIRVDDIEPLITAIRMLRGVLRVEPHIKDSTTWMAEQRALQELRELIYAVLDPKR